MIRVRNVSKEFNLNHKRRATALSCVISLFGPYAKRKILALDDLSFEVRRGEVFGIIGRNGSGKSTLLRIIAGIYIADKGEVVTAGRLAYLVSFRQGLKRKLTMRENIYLVGSLMGLSQKNIKGVFDLIVGFSGLGDFVDAGIYQFSSGMLARLSFSIVINCLIYQRPDILLLDEVFSAGGDIGFRARALKKIEGFIRAGATIIMAGHHLPTLERYSDRLLWLDGGRAVMTGLPGEIIRAYTKNACKR